MSILGTFSTASINGFQNPNVVQGITTLQIISSPNARNNAIFGYSIDCTDNADRIVIGEPAGGGMAGNAYVYTKSGNIWSLETTVNNATVNNNFGQSVAISGDGNYMVIGASGLGQAFVYTRSGTTWSLSQTLTGTPDFGYAVAINEDGTYIAVSQPNHSTSAGRFFIYYRATTTFNLQSTQTETQTNVRLGYDLAMDDNGDFVVATFNDTNFTQIRGRPFITFRTGNTWSNVATVFSGGIEPRSSLIASSNDGTKMAYTTTSGNTTSFYNVYVGNSTAAFSNTVTLTNDGSGIALDSNAANFARNGYFQGPNVTYLTGSNISCALDTTSTYRIFGSYRSAFSGFNQAGLVYIFE